MHEQNFEKQVQQKMEELSLTPSAPVWQKVEEQIRKKKDRRRLIFWLFPLLLAGGSAWWLLSGGNVRMATSETVSITKQKPVPPAEDPETTPAPATTPAEKEETLNTGSEYNTSTTRPNTPKNNYQTARTRQPQLSATLINTSLIIATGENEVPATISETMKSDRAEVAETGQNETEGNKKEVAVNQQQATISEGTNAIPVTVVDSITSLQVDTITGTRVINPAPAVAINTPSAGADTATLAPAAPKQQLNIKEWQWTVHAEAGITSVLAALFQLPATRTYDAFSSPALSGGGNFFAYYPSPQEAGPAFSAGLSVKRRLRNRLKLTAGVQYNYYSTKMAVGQEKNASAASTVPYARQSVTADNSYLPGVQNDYSNRYHFIQFPVGVEYQVFRNLPLQVHGGAIVAHLVNTNALTYDYQAQAYYQNRSVFNATQLHLFTHLSYSVWKGKHKKLDVGPYVQYSLTELQKTAPDKNRLFSTGLRTQFSF